MLRLWIIWMVLAGAMFGQATTVFIVRHAEKLSEAPDALLSDKGKARAECLARTLADANIGAIYVSELQRTQQTAAPIAQARGVKPQVVPVHETAALVSDIKAERGHNVLVVNHGNTIPEIVRQLGAGEVQPMPSPEYDRMIVVEINGGKAEPQITLHYCMQ